MTLLLPYVRGSWRLLALALALAAVNQVFSLLLNAGCFVLAG